MSQSISIALLAVGVILILLGMNAAETFSPDMSRLFTEAPKDKATWSFLGGALALVTGLVMLFQRSKSTW